jgi:hypothetical protein
MPVAAYQDFEATAIYSPDALEMFLRQSCCLAVLKIAAGLMIMVERQAARGLAKPDRAGYPAAAAAFGGATFTASLP